MELKNIKVTEKVKSELDAVAYDKETYNVTIERLMRENRSLKIENIRLQYDKDFLMKMVLKDESIAELGIEHKFVPFITSVLFENDLSAAERLEYLKKYFTEIANADKSVIGNGAIAPKSAPQQQSQPADLPIESSDVGDNNQQTGEEQNQEQQEEAKRQQEEAAAQEQANQAQQ